ncbi:MAG: hypothetical protein AAGI66_04185 [Cyanobacteria bacterium P01_H01_bin.74]
MKKFEFIQKGKQPMRSIAFHASFFHSTPQEANLPASLSLLFCRFSGWLPVFILVVAFYALPEQSFASEFNKTAGKRIQPVYIAQVANDKSAVTPLLEPIDNEAVRNIWTNQSDDDVSFESLNSKDRTLKQNTLQPDEPSGNAFQNDFQEDSQPEHTASSPLQPLSGVQARTSSQTVKSNFESTRILPSKALQNSTKPGQTVLTVQTGTQKVPNGTVLTIGFNTLLDSTVSENGDPFSVYLINDFTSSTPEGKAIKILLPAGTTIRGRISDVERPSFFSKGGSLFLSFDHIVLPSGELLPVKLNLSTSNGIVNQEGAVYSDPGIGSKVKDGVKSGQETFGSITDKGYAAGKSIAGGLGSLVTVPAAVIGGAFAGTAVTTGKAAVALVGKGDSAVIHPGDQMQIDFGGAFVLPAQ